MATAVIPAPNPSYQVGPITTQSQSVVRRSRVEIFTTTPQTYTGLGAGTSFQTTAYIDLASNEEFLDIQKSVFKFDLTFTSSAVDGVCLQQGVESFVYYLSIGAATGLKLEEIQNYNQLAATIEFFTKSANSVEHHMLDRTDYCFTPHKCNGRQGLFDAPAPLVLENWIECGRTYQLYLRLHQSSLLSSMRYIPLFLLRNGLRIMITFDNAYRITYNPIHADPSGDVVVPLTGNHRPNHFPVICSQGPDTLSETVLPIIAGADGAAGGAGAAGETKVADFSMNAPVAGGVYYPPFGKPTTTVADHYTTSQVALTSLYKYGLQQVTSTTSGVNTWSWLPVHNVLWLRKSTFCQVMSRWGEQSPRMSDTYYQMIHIPVTVLEKDQILWSGFASTVLAGPHDQVAWETTGGRGTLPRTATVANSGADAGTTALATTLIAKFVNLNNTHLAGFSGMHTDQWVAINDATKMNSGVNYSMMTYVEPADTTIQLSRFRPLLDRTGDYAVEGAATVTVDALQPVDDYDSLGSYPGGSGGGDALQGWYYGFALYSYGADQCNIPLMSFNQGATAVSAADLFTANKNFKDRGGKYIFHKNDYVVTTHRFTRGAGSKIGVAAGGTLTGTFDGFSIDEAPLRGQLYNYLKSLTVAPTSRTLTYTIEKFGMILDLVKPDSATFMDWQKKFIDNTGINYGVTDITYREQQITVTTGLVQITLPIHKRSLNRLLFTMRDFNFGTGECANICSKFFFATLKSYQRRGLMKAKLVIGGQQYPVYELQMRKDNGTFQEYNSLHLLEMEQVFGVSGSASFNPSFTLNDLDPGRRNYLGCGAIQYTQTSQLKSLIPSQPTGTQSVTINGTATNRINTMYYRDSSCFIFGFNLARINGDFSSGVDTTQAGSVQLQLQFGTDSAEYVSYYGNTNFILDCWAFSDGLVTLQNISNVKRS